MTASNSSCITSRASQHASIRVAVFSAALLGAQGFSTLSTVPSNLALRSPVKSCPSNIPQCRNFEVLQLPRTLRRHSFSMNILMSTADGVAAVENETAIDAAVLKRLDAEMKSAAERRKRLEAELEKMQSKLKAEEAKIQEIVSKKNQYLEGAKLGVIPRERTFSETPIRSAVKAMAWRVIAGLVTLATAFRFSRSLSTAFSIVGSDFFSKSFTMFLGERLMNKSSAGRQTGADNVGRSLAKALVWRLFAITNTLIMSVFIAKNLSVASKIAGTDAIIKTTLMFIYERVWARIEWGKEYAIEFSI